MGACTFLEALRMHAVCLWPKIALSCWQLQVLDGSMLSRGGHLQSSGHLQACWLELAHMHILVSLNSWKLQTMGTWLTVPPGVGQASAPLSSNKGNSIATL